MKKSDDIKVKAVKSALEAKETAEKATRAVKKTADKAVKAAADKASKMTEDTPLKDAEKVVREAAAKVSKEAAEKSEVVREAVKKARKAVVKHAVTIEFQGRQIVAKDVLAACEKAYDEREDKKPVKALDVYIKPEENCAYYVVNGEGSDEYRVEL